MRVWALASCSGLLALAACSAEQPQSTQVDLPSPFEEDASQVDALASAVLPRPVGTPQARLGTLRPTTTPLTSAPTADRPPATSPQALRARVQQIRSQSVTVPSPAMPLVHSVAVPSAPEPAEAINPESATVASLSVAAPQVTPLPAEPRPVALDPGFAHGGWEAAPFRYGSEAIAGQSGTLAEPTALALGPTQPANLERSYPLRHNRHQGHSARLGRAPQLTPEVSSVARYSSPTVAERRVAPSDHQTAVSVAVNRLTPSQALFPELAPHSAGNANRAEPSQPESIQPHRESTDTDSLEAAAQAQGDRQSPPLSEPRSLGDQTALATPPDQPTAAVEPAIALPTAAAKPQSPLAVENPALDQSGPAPTLETSNIDAARPDDPASPTVGPGSEVDSTADQVSWQPAPVGIEPWSSQDGSAQDDSDRDSVEMALDAEDPDLALRLGDGEAFPAPGGMPTDRHWSSAPAHLSLSLPLTPDSMAVPSPQFSEEIGSAQGANKASGRDGDTPTDLGAAEQPMPNSLFGANGAHKRR